MIEFVAGLLAGAVLLGTVETLINKRRTGSWFGPGTGGSRETEGGDE